jgi:hypothetical protein
MKENIVNELSCTKNCEKVKILIDEFETCLGIKKTETGNCELNDDDQKSETRTIKRRCAWCGKILGEKLAEGSGVKYGDITDGMCDNCQDEFRLEGIARSVPYGNINSFNDISCGFYTLAGC